MVTVNFVYICAALVFILFVIHINVIIFVICLLLSIILGIVIYLDRQIPSIEKDYEVFKENRSIHFIERDTRLWNHLSDVIENKIDFVSSFEFNKKFTHQSEVDNQLNEVLQLVFQDFIHPWQQHVSISQEFPSKLYLFINYTISAFARRLKDINVANLLTSKLLDELIKHNRLYRLTKNKLANKTYSNDEFISMFFVNERKLEKRFSREKLCLHQDEFVHFLDQICDILQYILFPYNSFNNETFRLFTKGIFIKTVLLPLFDLFSEPDFINGIIIAINKSNVPSTDTFMAVLQSTEVAEELKAVLESVESEIIFVRSKDDNDDEMKMKQQLGSLIYLKKIILSHLKKFDGSDDSKSISDSLNGEETESKSEEFVKSASISFDSILRHSVGLEYFTEFMSSVNASSYINFFINVEAFKISVEQGLFEIYLSSFGDGASDEQCQQLKQLVLEAAMNIYETYLSPIAPNRLNMIDESFCDKLRDQLSSNDSSSWMTESLFDDIFYQVRDIILKHSEFFPAFKRNKHYMKLLCETDLVKEQIDDSSALDSAKSEHSELSSISSGFSGGDEKSFDNGHDSELGKLIDSIDGEERKEIDDKVDFASGFTIEIIETGMLNEHGKTFVAYLINVEKSNGDKWVILRRYSEFFAFHQLLLDKCEKFHFNLKTILFLPPKTVLSNRMNRHFIQYRKYMLNLYLKKLYFLYERFNFLREDIETFLHPGNYNGKQSGRSEVNASKNGRFNPIRTIGNVMKNGSENILDGFQKLGRTLSLQNDSQRSGEKKVFQANSLNIKVNTGVNGPSRNSSEEFEPSQINGSKIDFDKVVFEGSETEENIPLLALLDEVFDLKNQNFWFRRRIIDLFKQIIEATYSDMINRKISDYIDEWTSPKSLSEYINLFMNSFWPNGHLAESTSRKEEDILRRKVAAKALILTSLNDLKKVVGSEALQIGLMSSFELFQQKTLNRRLVIVIFELLFKEIFPHNYFEEIFARLYTSFDDKSNSSPSSSTSSDHKADWPPHLSKFIARI